MGGVSGYGLEVLPAQAYPIQGCVSDLVSDFREFGTARQNHIGCVKTLGAMGLQKFDSDSIILRTVPRRLQIVTDC